MFHLRPGDGVPHVRPGGPLLGSERGRFIRRSGPAVPGEVVVHEIHDPAQPIKTKLLIGDRPTGLTYSRPVIVAQELLESDGVRRLAHFAALGPGATIVNGCVRPSAGLTAVPIHDLPIVRYRAVRRPERDRTAADTLTHLRPGTPDGGGPR